jgi:hypothetical protein
MTPKELREKTLNASQLNMEKIYSAITVDLKEQAEDAFFIHRFALIDYIKKYGQITNDDEKLIFDRFKKEGFNTTRNEQRSLSSEISW